MFKLAVFLAACVAPAHGFGYFLNATDAPTPARTPEWQVTGTIDVSGMTLTEIWDNQVVFQAAIADAVSTPVAAADVLIQDVQESSRRKLTAQRKLDEDTTYVLTYIIINIENEEDANLVVASIITFTPETIETAIETILNDCENLGDLDGVDFDPSTCTDVIEKFDEFECDDVASEDEIETEPEDPVFSDAPTMAPTPQAEYSYSYAPPQWWTDLLA